MELIKGLGTGRPVGKGARHGDKNGHGVESKKQAKITRIYFDVIRVVILK